MESDLEDLQETIQIVETNRGALPGAPGVPV